MHYHFQNHIFQQYEHKHSLGYLNKLRGFENEEQAFYPYPLLIENKSLQTSW